MYFSFHFYNGPSDFYIEKVGKLDKEVYVEFI